MGSVVEMNDHILRQLKYDSITSQLKKCKRSFVFTSVRYHTKKNPIYIITHLFSYVIRFVAYVNGYSTYTHSAYVLPDSLSGKHPRIVEAVGSGVNHASIYDKYFNGDFHGVVSFQIIPALLTKEKRKEHRDFILYETLGKKYSLFKALKAAIGLNRKDRKDTVYCTDLAIDHYESLLGKELVGNNARYRPGQLHDLLAKKGAKEIIFDTKNITSSTKNKG